MIDRVSPGESLALLRSAAWHNRKIDQINRNSRPGSGQWGTGGTLDPVTHSLRIGWFELTAALTYPEDDTKPPYTDNPKEIYYSGYTDKYSAKTCRAPRRLYYPLALQNDSDQFIKCPELATGMWVVAIYNPQSCRWEIVGRAFDELQRVEVLENKVPDQSQPVEDIPVSCDFVDSDAMGNATVQMDAPHFLGICRAGHEATGHAGTLGYAIRNTLRNRWEFVGHQFKHFTEALAIGTDSEVVIDAPEDHTDDPLPYYRAGKGTASYWWMRYAETNQDLEDSGQDSGTDHVWNLTHAPIYGGDRMIIGLDSQENRWIVFDTENSKLEVMDTGDPTPAVDVWPCNVIKFDENDFGLVDAGAGEKTVTITVDDSGIDHNQTANYDANEHIDWTAEFVQASSYPGDDLGAKINAAIADNARNIILPTGDQTITTPIVLDHDHVYLTGSGQSGTTLKFDASSVSPLIATDGNSRTDLTITGIACYNTSDNWEGVGIDLNKAQRCIVREVYTWKVQTGIYLRGVGCHYNTIEYCKCQIEDGSAIGVKIDSDAKGNYVIRCKMSPTVAGAIGYQVASQGCVFRDCDASGSGTVAFDLLATAYETLIENPWIEGLTYGIQIADGADQTMAIGGHYATPVAANRFRELGSGKFTYLNPDDDEYRFDGDLTINGQTVNTDAAFPVSKDVRSTSVTASIRGASAVSHVTSGTAAAGFGVARYFFLENAAGTPDCYGGLIATRWNNAAAESEIGEVILTGAYHNQDPYAYQHLVIRPVSEVYANVLIPHDNAKLLIGASGDLEVYHDGSDTYVTNNTGDLKLSAAGGTINCADDDLLSGGHLALGGASISANYGIIYDELLTDTDNTAKAAAALGLQIAKTTAAMTNSGSALVGSVILDATNTQNWTDTLGLRGVYGYVGTELGSSGTIAGAAGFYTQAVIADAATLTNLYGLHIARPTVSGSKVTNEYGIYIADQDTGATLNYAIYTGLGVVRFGDDVQIGIDSKKLYRGTGNDVYDTWDGADWVFDLSGATTASGHFDIKLNDNAGTSHFIIRDSDGTIVSSCDSDGNYWLGSSIVIQQRSSDPSKPGAGEGILWFSDGSGYGDAGDLCAASTVGETTKRAIIFDHSAGDVWA